MVKLDQFKDSEGIIDWKGVHLAEIDAGDKCYKCHAFVFHLSKDCKKRLCQSCSRLQNADEVDHDSIIRCPHCLFEEDVSVGDYDIWEEGEHSVYCNSCGKEFKISTTVSFNFTSPAKENNS